MRVLLDRRALLTTLCGVFLVLSLATRVVWVGYLAAAFGSVFAIESAFQSIKERTLDVNLLMVLAAVGAIAVGHVDDAAALLFLFSLSSTLESFAMSRTRSAIEGLIRLRPEKAILITDAGDETIETSRLAVGNQVRVLPFSQVPSDGTMQSEQATLNESSMTGESAPAEKSRGDQLLAGTQNLDQMLVMEVTTAPGDTTLERIVNLVEEAQTNKASGERISEWFGKSYTIFVLAAFCASFIIRTAIGSPVSDALYSSLILFVALSPCAIVISSPAATLSALAFAARRGVLVRGGIFIEAAGKITRVALDKTGTLTEGKPKLVEICIGLNQPVAVTTGAISAHPGSDECEILCWHRGESLTEESREWLRLAAAAESFSTHPLATAIVRAAKDHGIAVPNAESHEAHAGLGITATVEGKPIRIGQAKFFEGVGGGLPREFQEHVWEMQSRGITGVMMYADSRWCCFGLRDEPRTSAPHFIKSLKQLGVRHISMLTGDNPGTAQAVASELGIDEVHAGMLPQEKSDRIAAWTAGGEQVMMIGDGINDAPALAKASLGVAMGGLGSDVALNAADVVLVQDRVERIPELVALGRSANRIIRANLAFGAGMIVTLALLSTFWNLIPGLTRLAGQMPLPMAVIGHEGSTVLVILNGLRLLRGPGKT